ncbi:hypothetical protein CKM354_000556500 [Cercospora kikuchii]|uniref:Uncharacterized protein n=1 Tax=Cercospora kikuchii TaxID=84275 RepID=A0A9P3CKU1_9PEZI|nr:uncharacterized protein CKM354_000556500 [Cercospora kikuchii]GIZ42290.1 hypothetical protein CKM354_000556500 [Cercospora kikuchii]
MAPNRPNPVGSLYDTAEAQPSEQELALSKSLANPRIKSLRPQTASRQGHRPDGHPVRDDSLPKAPTAYPPAPPEDYTLWPPVDPAAYERMQQGPAPAQPPPASNSVDRFEDFLVSLPFEPVDRALADTYDAGKTMAKKVGRAASKGLQRIPQALRRKEPEAHEPVIGDPTLEQWDNPSGHELVSLTRARAIEPLRAKGWWDTEEEIVRRAERDAAAAAAPQNVILAKAAAEEHSSRRPVTALARQRTAAVLQTATENWAEEFAVTSHPATDEWVRGHVPHGYVLHSPRPIAHAVPEQPDTAPRPSTAPKPRRRVVESTWADFQRAAERSDSPPEAPVPEPVVPPRPNDAAGMSRTTRKPVPRGNMDKSLPPSPRPESSRRKTFLPPQEANDGFGSPVPLALRPGTQYRPTYKPVRVEPYVEPDEEDQKTRAAALDMLEGRTEEASVRGKNVRTGEIKAHVHQAHEGKPVDSWHVQHGRASRFTEHLKPRVSDEDDDATNIWKKLEEDAGYAGFRER